MLRVHLSEMRLSQRGSQEMTVRFEASWRGSPCSRMRLFSQVSVAGFAASQAPSILVLLEFALVPSLRLRLISGLIVFG